MMEAQYARVDDIRHCADCGDTFAVTPSEIDWFIKRGLRVPRRCKSCRALARQEREASGGR
jgi:hypothetical protein